MRLDFLEHPAKIFYINSSSNDILPVSFAFLILNGQIENFNFFRNSLLHETRRKVYDGSGTLVVFIVNSVAKPNKAIFGRLIELVIVPNSSDLDLILQPKVVPEISPCLQIYHQIFPTRRSIPDVGKSDAYFAASQSIMLDFYKVSDNNYVRMRNMKNRHHMVVKVVLKHLNLSVDACGSHRFLEDGSQRHLDFGISSYKQQHEKLQTASLIHSGEQFRIIFASMRREVFSGMFVSLVKPIGTQVLVFSLVLIVLLTTFLWLYVKFLVKVGQKRAALSETKVVDVILYLFRGHVDQCVDTGNVFRGHHRNDLKVLHAAWLCYTLLVLAAYRSNLIDTLMQPGSYERHETFEQLANDERTIVGIGLEGRPGQSSNIRTIMAGEVAKSKSDSTHTFERIGAKFNKSYVPNALEILEGRFNFMDDEIMVEKTFLVLEKRYGVHHYEIGRESLKNEEFWSVSHSAPKARQILRVIRHLAECGALDNFRREQESVGETILEKYLQILFAPIFAEDKVDDEGEDYDTLEDLAEWYERLRLKLALFGLRDLEQMPKRLKIKNFFATGILLGGGVLLGFFIFLGEMATPKKCYRSSK